MKRLFQSPRWITVWLVLLALVLYGMLARGQGEIRSVAFGQDDIIYSAAGRHGGVVAIDAHITAVHYQSPTPTPTETLPPEGTGTEENRAQSTVTPTATLTETSTETPTASATQGSPQPSGTVTPKVTSTPIATITPIVTYDMTHELTQRKRFDTPGNAVAVVPYELGERSLILVADAGYGLQVYDVNVDEEDPQMLLTVPLPDVRDVAVCENIIYVAAGEHGVFVVTLREILPAVAPIQPEATPEPTAIPPLSYTVRGLPRRGEANNLAFFITSQTSYSIQSVSVAHGTPVSDGVDPEPPDIQNIMESTHPFLFIADGSAGITVFDLLANAGGTPTPIAFDEPEGDVRAIWISYIEQLQHSYHIAYVAAGAQGLLVLDISKPETIDLVASYALDGAEALDVAALEGHAYVAAGKDGLYILDVKDPQNIQLVNHFTAIGDQIYAVGVYKKYVFLAAGQDGVYVLRVNDPKNPELTGDGYGLDWGENSLGYASGALWDKEEKEVPKRTRELLLRGLLDLGLAVVAVFVCLMIFAGFVLPADSPMQRFRVLGRMFQSFFGGHPVAWFIDDGEVHPWAQERLHGLGVAVLDAGSAAVFVNHEQRWQVAGPGMCFVNDDDQLLGAVGLRQQAMLVGPLLGEDPFPWRGQDENRAVFRARQFRRQATSAQTRDGVEVVATLRVVFSLDGRAVEGGTQYGYDEARISRSVASENLPATERRRPGRVPWLVQETLSAMLHRLWEENLRCYALAELFSPFGRGTAETGLERVMRTLYAHLTQPETRELDENGVETGRQFLSREFRTLNGRGIHVSAVYLEAIHYAARDEQQAARRWQEELPAHTAEEKKRLDTLDEQSNLLAYAQALTTDLANRIRNLLNPPSLKESLRYLLKGSQEAAPPSSDEAGQVEQLLDELGGKPQ